MLIIISFVNQVVPLNDMYCNLRSYKIFINENSTSTNNNNQNINYPSIGNRKKILERRKRIHSPRKSTNSASIAMDINSDLVSNNPIGLSKINNDYLNQSENQLQKTKECLEEIQLDLDNEFMQIENMDDILKNHT
jgi:hypothetical protein